MSNTLDPYATLGVSRRASAADLRRAYRRRVRTAHPDRGGSTAAFVRVQSSYELLSDPQARARYDAGIVGDEGVEDTSARWPTSRWYWRAVGVIFSALVLSSLGRWWGVLPHALARPGEHLVLGNFVVRGSYWVQHAAWGHPGFYGALGLAVLESMVLALPWKGRLRYRVGVRTRELLVYGLGVFLWFVAQESCVPSAVGAGVYVGVVLGWLGWVTHRERTALVVVR